MQPLATLNLWMERIRDRERAGTFARFLARRFLDDRLFQAAAALAYTTIFALVPLAIVVLGVLSAFPVFGEWRDQLTEYIFSNFVPSAASAVKETLRLADAGGQRLGLVETWQDDRDLHLVRAHDEPATFPAAGLPSGSGASSAPGPRIILRAEKMSKRFGDVVAVDQLWSKLHHHPRTGIAGGRFQQQHRLELVVVPDRERSAIVGRLRMQVAHCRDGEQANGEQW